MKNRKQSRYHERSREKKHSNHELRSSTSPQRKNKRKYSKSVSSSSSSSSYYSSSSSSSSSSYSSSFSSSSSSLSSNSSEHSQTSSPSAALRHQTAHFHYRKGEKLNHRYKVRKLLGDGTFGRVVECEYRGAIYAVKIIKPVQKYISSARTEREIIKRINQRDFNDQKGIVRYIQSFYHHNYFCMVFMPLGKSLYQFIKMNSFIGFPLPMVQSFFKQILNSIGFLHRIGYTHTDLKPQNILLENKHYTEIPKEQSPSRNKYYLPVSDKIRIIDFGGATRHDDHHSVIINTRQYRSPEVILQCCKWDQISDLWSIGCIICELYTGEQFFPTHSDEEHLAMMEKNFGKFPQWMIQKIPSGRSLRKVFRDGYINQDKIAHIQNVIGLRTLPQIFPSQPELVDLLRRCLQLDPNRRINCIEALKHPFFSLTL